MSHSNTIPQGKRQRPFHLSMKNTCSVTSQQTRGIVRDIVAAAQAGRESPAELLLVLADVSGSMNTQDMQGKTRVQASQDALTCTFQTKLNIDSLDELGIISFASHSVVCLERTKIFNSFVVQDAIDNIDDPRTGGGTNFSKALDLVKKMFLQNGLRREGRVWRLLIISDGWDRTEQKALRIANELKQQHGVFIHTIGVAGTPEAPNTSFLEKLASTVNEQKQYAYINNIQFLQTHAVVLGQKMATQVWSAKPNMLPVTQGR